MDNQFHARIVQTIKQTPVLSPSAANLLQVVANADHSIQEIVEIISGDFALTGRILQVANSVIFNPLQPIASIDRAVAYLGEVYIISLALSSCMTAINDSPLTGYEGNRHDLWRHQLFCAIASKIAARHAKGKLSVDLAFTGGLLHDIGKAIISEHIVDSAGEILDGIAEGRFEDYMDAEEKLFGLDHVRVGHLLAQHWKLPEVLQDIILYHHHPDRAPPEHQALVYAVHLGDVLSMLTGYDTGSDGLKYHLDGGNGAFFNLSDITLESIQCEACQEFERFETSTNP